MRWLAHARVADGDGWQEDLAEVDAADREGAVDRAEAILRKRWGRKATIVIKHVESESICAARPPCACGSGDASWRGDTMRVYSCAACWESSRQR